MKFETAPFCHGDEENGHHACMDGHLTTADQSEIRKANLVSVETKRTDIVPQENYILSF